MERYKTVIEKVKEANDLSLYFTLRNLASPKERLAELQARLAFTADRHYDDESARLAGWLFDAISDVALTPHLIEKKPGEISLPWANSTTDPVALAKKQAASQRAAEAMAIYCGVLPRFREQSERVRSQEEGTHEIKREVPTLLKTRAVILGEVARQWRSTSDEAEADRLFGFLQGLRPHFGEEREAVCEAIKTATDRTFPIDRITRNITSLLGEGRDPVVVSDILPILLLCRARTISAEQARQEFGVLATTIGMTNAAFAHLRKEGEKAAEVDAQLRELLDTLQPCSPAGLIDYSKPHVVGTIDVVYRSLVLIKVSVHYACDRSRERDDSRFHEYFEQARALIVAWMEKQERKFAVQFSYWAEDTGWNKKPPFVREQVITVLSMN